MIKLLPAIAMMGGAAVSAPKISAQISKMKGATQTIVVQTELNALAKMIYVDSLEGQRPTPENFPEYVRKNMRAPNGGERDTSLDYWQTPYKLVYDQQRIVVFSAGPDLTFETEDDISASYRL